MAYWPAWVVNRCIRIKSLVASGRSLDEIGKLLISIDDEARSPARNYVFREVQARFDFEDAVVGFVATVSSKVAEFSRKFGGFNHDVVWQVDREIARRETVAKILKLARQGIHVVLVLQEGSMNVMPDFLVSHSLSDDVAGSQPLVVIPISAEIRRAFSRVTSGIPDQPTIIPSHVVVEEAEDGNYDAMFKITPRAGVRIIRKRRTGKRK
jgi:hypothetical protein